MDAKPAPHPKIVVGSGLLCKRGAILADTLRLGSFTTSWLETDSENLFFKSQNTFQLSVSYHFHLFNENILANSVCIVNGQNKTHRLCFFSIFVGTIITHRKKKKHIQGSWYCSFMSDGAVPLPLLVLRVGWTYDIYNSTAFHCLTRLTPLLHRWFHLHRSLTFANFQKNSIKERIKPHNLG